MDLGFTGGFCFGNRYYDRLPFEITWANDIDDAACDTYERNLGSIHRGDIGGVMDTLPKSADVVIGGFPCQDVSINGSRLAGDGSRTILYREMIEVLRRVRPRVFVAENVKGLQQAQGREMFAKMLSEFESCGYKVGSHLYTASDYGVPQRRERVFIVGVKGRRRFEHPGGSESIMTVKDALYDLEETPEDPATSHQWSKAARSPEQGDRFLVADRPATTIRAEHHGNTQWHYNQPRRISLRESARLQSFPDEFSFTAGMRATERQIGNAVPPVLAWHVARAVREYFERSRVRASANAYMQPTHE